MKRKLRQKFWSQGTNLGSPWGLLAKGIPQIFSHMTFWVALKVHKHPLVPLFMVVFIPLGDSSSHQCWRLQSRCGENTFHRMQYFILNVYSYLYVCKSWNGSVSSRKYCYSLRFLHILKMLCCSIYMFLFCRGDLFTFIVL